VVHVLAPKAASGKWPSDEERRALEDWVRLRFQLVCSDPMVAIIGAVGRLTEAGMTSDDATDIVLRILNEGQDRAAVAEGPDSGPPCATGYSPRKAFVRPLGPL
jgi:hypothetical protein